MEETNDQVLRIEEKLQQLLKQYQHLQKENQLLQKDNLKLKEQFQLATDQKNRLSQQVGALKINGNAIEGNAKKELEKHINTYLKDIEHCLALLHA